MNNNPWQQADPRAQSGPFADLMADIRKCKEAGTCPSLTSRTYGRVPGTHDLIIDEPA